MADTEPLSLNEPTISDKDFARLGHFIEATSGIRMPSGKRLLLESRLRRRLRALDLPDFTAYCERVLGGDETELVAMLDAVTTNKTGFFREPKHFEYLRTHAVPTFRALPQGLRVWSSACSMGAEPWSIAMVLAELSETKPLQYDILASDLSTEMLAEAEQAIYAEAVVEPVPLPMRQKYLLRRRDGSPVVRIGPTLRSRVRFERVNLVEPHLERLGRFEIIFCRNVFIYFDRVVQLSILQHFCRMLEPGGYLFLGHSESTSGFDVPLKQVAPTVYKKTEGV